MPSYFGNYKLFVIEKIGGANLTGMLLLNIEASTYSLLLNVEGANIKNNYIYICMKLNIFHFKI